MPMTTITAATIDRLRSRAADLLKLTDDKLDRRLSLLAPPGAANGDLITAIGREFARGYNDTLETFETAAVSAHVDAQDDDYLAPFYVEGAAMAFAASRVLHPSRASSAHRVLLTDLHGHRYLTLAGWGWWYAVRPFGAFALRRSSIWRQGGLFGGLGIDGMAFATCFLKAAPPHFDVRCPFPEPEFQALWLQGHGRALWFVAGGYPEIFRYHAERLEPHQRPELHAGLGLASAFAGVRRLSALPAPPSADQSEQRAFCQGLAFGLTARREASPRSFQRLLERLDHADADWVTAATDLCLHPPEPSATAPDGGYVAWQRRVRSDLPLPWRQA